MSRANYTLPELDRVIVSRHQEIDEGLRICVTGGRDFKDSAFVFACLDAIHANDPIVELGAGCASGVDTFCLDWAKANDVPWRKYVAHWDFFGDAAGSLRNEEMLEDFQPHRLEIFPGGTGTTDCARRARRKKFARNFHEYWDLHEELTKWG